MLKLYAFLSGKPWWANDDERSIAQPIAQDPYKHVSSQAGTGTF